MKKLYSILAGAGLLLEANVERAAAQDSIAQVHFAGAQKISADANFTAFTNEFCSAEALALRVQTADKLSRWLAGWLAREINANVPDGATTLRPLFDDLQKSEWYLDAQIMADGRPAVALAIKLDGGRAQFWRASLTPFFVNATERPAFKSFGGWLIFSYGTGTSALVQKISAANSDWFSADLNWPRLETIFQSLQKLDLPKTQLRVTARDGNFQISGKLTLAQMLPPLEPWRVPTNSLHQPFISFTAVRGFAPWLEKQRWAQPYEISPPPQQFFAWALPQIPFQTFVATPVPDAKSALAQLDATLPKAAAPAAGPQNFFTMPLRTELAGNEITFQGIPFASPFIKAQREAAGDFLFGGFFPNTPRSKPLPPELFARLATPDLVFYHWEITAERLKPLPELAQLLLLVSHHRQLDGNSAADKWLARIGPTLGNTVTEATQTAPDEITFKRTAPGIFTAVEFFALASWLEAPNFPGCDLTLPSRPMNFKHAHPQLPGGTPAPPFQLHQIN